MQLNCVKKLHEKLNWMYVGFPERTAQFSVWKTTGKYSSEARFFACQNCAVYSVISPSGMTSHNKIAQFNFHILHLFLIYHNPYWGWCLWDSHCLSFSHTHFHSVTSSSFNPSIIDAVDYRLTLWSPLIMYTNRFNIQQLYVLPTLYIFVLYLSENKQRLVPRTA